jgi:hypothetical protein
MTWVTQRQGRCTFKAFGLQPSKSRKEEVSILNSSLDNYFEIQSKSLDIATDSTKEKVLITAIMLCKKQSINWAKVFFDQAKEGVLKREDYKDPMKN